MGLISRLLDDEDYSHTIGSRKRPQRRAPQTVSPITPNGLLKLTAVGTQCGAGTRACRIETRLDALSISSAASRVAWDMSAAHPDESGCSRLESLRHQVVPTAVSCNKPFGVMGDTVGVP